MSLRIPISMRVIYIPGSDFDLFELPMASSVCGTTTFDLAGHEATPGKTRSPSAGIQRIGGPQTPSVAENVDEEYHSRRYVNCCVPLLRDLATTKELQEMSIQPCEWNLSRPCTETKAIEASDSDPSSAFPGKCIATSSQNFLEVDKDFATDDRSGRRGTRNPTGR
ncbi:hypothetical protein PSPO01_14620 [Paraphaeosphaeria sporulosa]